MRGDGSWIGRVADPEGSPKRAHHASIAAIALDEHHDLSLLDDLSMPDGMAKGMDEEAVRAGKKLGLIMLERYQVVTDITRADAQARGLKNIKARWELREKADGTIKARYVAQEFKWLEDLDDTFAPTGSVCTSRVVDAVWALNSATYGVFVADCVSAYYQAEQTEAVCVEAPGEYHAILAARSGAGGASDLVWELNKMLPGQRVAGAGWVRTLALKLQGLGFDRCETHPQFYIRRHDDVLFECHMDDLYGGRPSHGGERNGCAVARRAGHQGFTCCDARPR